MRRMKIEWVFRIAKQGAPLVIALVGLVLMIAWLAGAFHEKISPGETVTALKEFEGQPTDVVHEVTKAYIEEAVGTLKAASRSVISSKILARIEEIAVKAGDQVEEKGLLIHLDSKELEAKHEQAKQAVATAIANRKEADANFVRIEQLYKSKAVSTADMDEATRQRDVARAEVARLEQAVAEASVVLSYTTIAAPKGGRIVDRLAEPGDTARPGEPILVLYDATSLRLEAPVPEHLAVKLRVGDKLNVYVDALQREVESTIDEIVPQADAPSRSLLVKASIPRSDDLFEGMFGRLRIPAGERRHLCLATDAIHNVGQLEFVEVVTDGKHIEKRFIKTGRLGMPGRIEVLSGLKAGERVVLRQSAEGTTDD